jgi:hypothetical protein
MQNRLRNIIAGESQRRVVLQKQRSRRPLHSCLLEHPIFPAGQDLVRPLRALYAEDVQLPANPFSGCQ